MGGAVFDVRYIVTSTPRNPPAALSSPTRTTAGLPSSVINLGVATTLPSRSREAWISNRPFPAGRTVANSRSSFPASR